MKFKDYEKLGLDTDSIDNEFKNIFTITKIEDQEREHIPNLSG